MPLTLINFYIALDGHFSGDMSFCNPLLMCEKLGSNDEQCKNVFTVLFFIKHIKILSKFSSKNWPLLHQNKYMLIRLSCHYKFDKNLQENPCRHREGCDKGRKMQIYSLYKDIWLHHRHHRRHCLPVKLSGAERTLSSYPV